MNIAKRFAAVALAALAGSGNRRSGRGLFLPPISDPRNGANYKLSAHKKRVQRRRTGRRGK